MLEVSRHTDREEESGCFQCPVPEDQSAATLRSGRRQVDVTVAETSIEGFTVLVDAKLIGRLSFDRAWKLKHLDASFDVAPEWLYNGPGGVAQIGVRRMRDWSQPPHQKTKRRGRTRLVSDVGSGTSLAFAGSVLVVFIALALPGIGDSLGTAPRINSAITSLAKLVSGWIR